MNEARLAYNVASVVSQNQMVSLALNLEQGERLLKLHEVVSQSNLWEIENFACSCS